MCARLYSSQPRRLPCCQAAPGCIQASRGGCPVVNRHGRPRANHTGGCSPVALLFFPAAKSAVTARATAPKCEAGLTHGRPGLLSVAPPSAMVTQRSSATSRSWASVRLLTAGGDQGRSQTVKQPAASRSPGSARAVAKSPHRARADGACSRTTAAARRAAKNTAPR